MSEQCRHSSTAKRPTRKKEEENTSTKAAVHNFSKKHSLTSTSPPLTRWSARQPSASPAPSSSRHWRPSPPWARRWGLGARTARTSSRPMRRQHVTVDRPIRDEKAQAPVAWSVSHFWARRREASLSLSLHPLKESLLHHHHLTNREHFTC